MLAYIMRRKGIQMVANAILDLKIITRSYEQQGSQWMVSKVVSRDGCMGVLRYIHQTVKFRSLFVD